MTKKNKLPKILFVSILCIIFLSCFIMLSSAKSNTAVKKGLGVELMSDESSSLIEIVNASGTDYKLIFSSDSRQSDATLATSLSNLIRKGTGFNLRVTPDTAAESEFEIILGDTNRAESTELLNMLRMYTSESHPYVWGYAYINGKLAYTSTSNIGFSLGMNDFLALVAEDGTLSVSSDLFFWNYMTYEQYEEYLREQEAIKRQEHIDSLIAKNDEFTDSQFNKSNSYKPMIDENGNGYFTKPTTGEPWAYPADDQHPRYLISEKSIEELRAILEDGKNQDSEYYKLANNFWALADSDEKAHNWGIFPSVSNKEYRYDGEVVAMIEAKALAYLITGDEIYAREAIICIKNAMLTMNYTSEIHIDTYHGAACLMVTVAEVYDWCYDILTENDKWQLIYGTVEILASQFENGMQYPPSGMNAVSGHGTGDQLLKSWLSVCVAFYDEVPDWYRFVAGRYFNEYVPVANLQFENGWVSQGTTTYGINKVYRHAYAATVIKTAVGENYLNDDVIKTMYYAISHITPYQTESTFKQYYFRTGDGTKLSTGALADCSAYFVLAALYNDPVIFAQAKLLSDNFSIYISLSTEMSMTPVLQLCFSAMVDYNGEGSRDGIDTIQYFAYPASSMTARESWGDPDSAAVLMRLGNLTMANHDCQDYGTFQIYYKGLLAGVSGAYGGSTGVAYGDPAHKYYEQATIATNGLLIYNPSLAGTDSSKASTYYYSGGQRYLSEAGTLENWTSGDYVMAETVGASWGYRADGSSEYAYIAGDLTKAYNESTVDFVGRRMFTLFTGNEDFPILFFTFDQIISDSESFTKHWLLHTVNEPTVDAQSFTATVINGEGKMYVSSLFGAEAIVKIGGEGRAWWINGDVSSDLWNTETGKNFGSAVSDMSDTFWGRIELRAGGEKYSNFLTVMAVTDTSNEKAFEIEKFTNEDSSIFGAKFEKNIVAFLNNSEKPEENRYKEFSFNTEGKGLYNYYISGIEAGTWNVKVDGISVAYSLSDEDEKFIEFTAPAGEVTVTPGKNVIGSNGGRVQYNSFGGVVPDTAPFSYNNENPVELPQNIKNGNNIFLGWYTSPAFEDDTRVTHTPTGMTGTFTVYAKYLTTIAYMDFNAPSFSIDATEKNTTKTFGFNANNKSGASFKSKYDDAGIKYIEWTEGTSDPNITYQNNNKNFSTMSDPDDCATYIISMSRDGDKQMMATSMRFTAYEKTDGTSFNSNLYVFNTNLNGEVRLGNDKENGPLVMTLTEEQTTIRFVVDFKNEQIRAYDEDGNPLATLDTEINTATGAANMSEWRLLCKRSMMNWHAESPADVDASMRLYSIKIDEGDRVAHAQPENAILYAHGDAKLPEGYPKTYECGTATALPTPEKQGYKFMGWYTSSSFEEGTFTESVPAGYEGHYTVYAKWEEIIVSETIVDENFSDVDIDLSEASGTYNDIVYDGEGVRYSSYKTEIDENGNKYLAFTPGVKASQITIDNETSSIAAIRGTSLSYTIKLSKNGEVNIPEFEFKVIGNHTVSGVEGTVENIIYLGKTSETGDFTLGESDTVIATIGADVVTIRIVLDFATGTISAYGETGEVIASTSMPEIPEESGALTYAEWMKCFRSNIFHCKRIGGTAKKRDQSIRLYGIKIETTNVFLPADEESAE